MRRDSPAEYDTVHVHELPHATQPGYNKRYCCCFFPLSLAVSGGIIERCVDDAHFG